ESVVVPAIGAVAAADIRELAAVPVDLLPALLAVLRFAPRAALRAMAGVYKVHVNFLIEVALSHRIRAYSAGNRKILQAAIRGRNPGIDRDPSIPGKHSKPYAL